MKKAKRLLMLSLFLSLLFVGCEKDLIIPEDIDPVVFEPQIDVTYKLLPLQMGQEVTLNWDTKYTTACYFEGKLVGLSGTAVDTVKYESTAVFTFIAEGEGGKKEKSVTVVTDKPLLPTISLIAYPETVLIGGKSMISIYSSNITSLSVNGVDLDPKTKVFNITPERDTTLIVTAIGPTGVAYDTLLVKVDLKLSWLIQNHWFITMLEVKDIYDGKWYEMTGGSSCTFTDTLYFRDSYYLSDGTYMRPLYYAYRYCDPDKPNNLIGAGDYRLENDQTVLFRGGSYYEILYFSVDSLRVTTSSGQIRITYSSKKNTGLEPVEY